MKYKGMNNPNISLIIIFFKIKFMFKFSIKKNKSQYHETYIIKSLDIDICFSKLIHFNILIILTVEKEKNKRYFLILFYLNNKKKFFFNTKL